MSSVQKCQECGSINSVPKDECHACYAMMAENVRSLSDDDEAIEIANVTNLSLLTEHQRQEIQQNGFCELDDPMDNQRAVSIVHGFVRECGEEYAIQALMRIIVHFSSLPYHGHYVQVVCGMTNFSYFLIPTKHVNLSNLLNKTTGMADTALIESDKVRPEVMFKVMQYLGHHKGTKPEEIAKPIRSVRMERIVADQWDVEFINTMDKKEVFQVICAANYLDIQSLVHLGCAKIATLIKGKSPEEIRDIMADTE